MSANHKRPLLAFVLVALACSMIIANGLRSQAVVSMVRAGAQHLVAGFDLVVADASAEPAVASDDSEPDLTPVGPVEVAAQRVFGGGRSLAPAGHTTGDGQQAKAHRTHGSHPTRHGHPAHGQARGHGRDHAKSHADKLGKSDSKGHGRSHRRGHGKSHTGHRNG